MTLVQAIARRPGVLQALRQQALDSARMWEQAAAGLPPALAGAVRPGRCADGVWTLVSSSPAVAAKLRLYAPLLLRRLRDGGWALQSIAVKVQPASEVATMAAEAEPARAAPPGVRARLAELRRRRGDLR